MTGQNQVNIVDHSKGGLDARAYLAQSGVHDEKVLHHFGVRLMV